MNGDMQRKSGGVVGLLGVMMAIYMSWCHSHIVMTLQLKLNKKQIIEARTVFSSRIYVVRTQRVNPRLALIGFQATEHVYTRDFCFSAMIAKAFKNFVTNSFCNYQRTFVNKKKISLFSKMNAIQTDESSFLMLPERFRRYLKKLGQRC